jgi:DNA repair photolyase
MQKLQQGPPASVIDEFLARRQPIHFGGMSDPFVPIEAEWKLTLKILRLFCTYDYPVVISTKSDLFATGPYLEVLRAGNFVIQVSLSSTDPIFSAEAEPGCAGPRRLLAALKVATSAGIPAMCRIQPVHPSREKDVFLVMDAARQAGASHVAVEHLKLPIERNWDGTSKLSRLLGFDLYNYYLEHKATRHGREWILPLCSRLPWMQEYRSYAHSIGLSFGAADNDLLLMSDGRCCCSGVDLLKPSIPFFAYTFTEAVRRGSENNEIKLDLLRDVWCPDGSVGQYVNSNSRLSASASSGSGIREYVRENWNGVHNGSSPTSLFGVIDSGTRDDNGYAIYSISPAASKILQLSQSHKVNADFTQSLQPRSPCE